MTEQAYTCNPSGGGHEVTIVLSKVEGFNMHRCNDDERRVVLSSGATYRLRKSDADAIESALSAASHPVSAPYKLDAGMVGAAEKAVARLEWRRNARELGAKKEALNLALEGSREAYVTRVLDSATCEVDCGDLALILSALQPVYAGAEPVACVVAFRERRKEPEFVSWNQMLVGEHRLYAHPPVSGGDADRLRVAFDPEDMRIVGDWINAGEPSATVPGGRIKSLWQSARQALAQPSAVKEG